MKNAKTGVSVSYPANRAATQSVSRAEQWLLQRVLSSCGNPPTQVRLWDGRIHYGHEGDRPGIRINSRAAFWRLVLNPDLGFGEGYQSGDIEVDGDLVSTMEAIYRFRPPEFGTGYLRDNFLRHGSQNTLTGSRKNIHHHYDIGNDFYRLWLDEEMVYTCAYFPSPEASIEQAQTAKMDHVCRKLDLKPGETVVEAGCGWGGLARHMARHYGVRVRAYNISREQVRYATERARAEGLDDRIEYVEDDYRNIEGEFDAFVSVGMLEHVGAENYQALGRVVDRVLRDTGRGLIHSIGQNEPKPLGPWLRKHIFPGAWVPTLSQMTQIMEPGDFSVLDVENLRLHYARTLSQWLERYEQRVDDVERMFDAEFVRAWRLYLSASVAAFSAGTLQLYQMLFARNGYNEMPWTRAYMYREEEA